MTLQRNSAGRTPGIGVPPIVHDVLRSTGQPLDSGTRGFFEPRFGRDFSGVRVHSDAKAAESARAVDASAYTVGRNIVFGPEFSPEAAPGRKLLAHELAHAVQQEGADFDGGSSLKVNDPHDSLEVEAEATARQVLAGDSRPQISRATPTLARQPASNADAELAKSRTAAEKALPAQFPAKGTRVIGPDAGKLAGILSNCTGIPVAIDNQGLLVQAQGPVESSKPVSKTAQAQLHSLLAVPDGIIVDTNPAALGVEVGIFGQMTPGYQNIAVTNIARLAEANGVGGGLSACDAVMHEMTEAAVGRNLSLTATSMVNEKAFRPAHAVGTAVESSIRKEQKLLPRSTKEVGDTVFLGNLSKDVKLGLDNFIFGEGKEAQTQINLFRCKVVQDGQGSPLCNIEVLASTVVKGIVHFTTPDQAIAVFNKNSKAFGFKPL